MLRGVVLDLDGTLADTATTHGEAWRRALSDLGIKARINVEQLLGKRAPEIALELTNGDSELAQRLVERKNAHFKELLSLVKPKPCSMELLSTLKEMGLRLTVVTSSNRVSAYSVLEATGLIKYLDYVVTGDDVSVGKPDPEPILRAMGLMGTSSSETVGIGDTIHDYEAYSRANLGLIVIIVNPLVNDKISLLENAVMVHSLCTINSLIRMFN